jgi:hypothetical protein
MRRKLKLPPRAKVWLPGVERPNQSKTKVPLLKRHKFGIRVAATRIG